MYYENWYNKNISRETLLHMFEIGDTKGFLWLLKRTWEDGYTKGYEDGEEDVSYKLIKE